jgi:hypothetical protein
VRSYGLGAHLGINVPLGRHFSWWPRASFAFGGTSFDNRNDGSSMSAPVESHSTYTASRIFLRAPFLAHLTSHFFIGFGPRLTRDLTRSREGSRLDLSETTIGADLLIGGWW